MNRQEFINRYLNTIIDFRKKYLALESSLSTSDVMAREINDITRCQQSLCEDLIRFILHPKNTLNFRDRKLINDELVKHD